MTIEMVPPGLIMIVAALLIALTRGTVRTAIVLAAPLLTLWAIFQVPDGVSLSAHFLGYNIELIEGSLVRRLFATVFSIMAFAGGLYSFRTARGVELAAAFAYAGGSIGVAFSGDLISFFLFWEWMAIFSTIVILSGGSAAARAAAFRYALVHFLGGVILMVGIAALYVQTGSVDVAAMKATDFASWMILIGILINAAAPPLSSWLPDAYPESSPTGMVFLSAYTTKTAVLALILLFPGEKVLVFVGLYMAVYGIMYALLENDARRILAYSIVNQVGFMVTGIGIGTEMAINGAAAHAFAHIIYKALLLMSAGVVLHRTGKSRCTDLGGLFRTMPITAFCGIIGALAISGVPLTSGFTTKTMISEAAALEHLPVVWFILAAASAGVFLHAGIKFPWFVFFQKDSGMRPKDAPWNMGLAMALLSGLCILLGVYPEPLYAMLPYPTDFHAYKGYKLVFYLQLLLFSGLAFFLLLPLMRRTRTVCLDTDWFYRKGGKAVASALTRVISSGYQGASAAVQGFLGKGQATISGLVGHERRLGSSWAIGTSVLWVLVLLVGYAVIYTLR
ncbi:Na(+)/H(+) antiporter subunit D [Iodidimonas gelatinilytica]|uniref:Na(+)/H(+) antiporter subunit D n=1 Tax=Iodidimonas gelatinilytica TaxID=1236966 RepID=A0A5A7MK29_9PROT|nr:Na(+)/H(+) antiporter subunit D [Iodidimonas gelatinilytica]GEQ96372.1 Na(+)/H(+) antiporter subunit D [Iodidimonas gelatinilytica]